jgi:Rrf2 family protein
MIASLKVEYSLRVLAQLARRHKPGTVVRIEDLAKAEAIPANYLVQLLNELREGELVASKRGKAGGYRLARNPSDISLQDVLAVVEPSLGKTRVTVKGASGPQVAALWREVSRRLEAELDKVTLAHLMRGGDGGDWEI